MPVRVWGPTSIFWHFTSLQLLKLPRLLCYSIMVLKLCWSFRMLHPSSKYLEIYEKSILHACAQRNCRAKHSGRTIALNEVMHFHWLSQCPITLIWGSQVNNDQTGQEKYIKVNKAHHTAYTADDIDYTFKNNLFKLWKYTWKLSNTRLTENKTQSLPKPKNKNVIYCS